MMCVPVSHQAIIKSWNCAFLWLGDMTNYTLLLGHSRLTSFTMRVMSLSRRHRRHPGKECKLTMATGAVCAIPICQRHFTARPELHHQLHSSSVPLVFTGVHSWATVPPIGWAHRTKLSRRTTCKLLCQDVVKYAKCSVGINIQIPCTTCKRDSLRSKSGRKRAAWTRGCQMLLC